MMQVPASDATKRCRLGKAIQRFITRALDDIGKRIDLVRYSAKHDAVGPRELLPGGKGGAADEFAEAVARVTDDQKRKRSAISDDTSSMARVRLPGETAYQTRLTNTSAAAPAAAESPAKRQKVQLHELSDDAEGPARGGADAGEPKWTPISLKAGHVAGRAPARFTIHVDSAGALKWLAAHGIQRACLPFQFGHACPHARRWGSCGSQGKGQHKEATEGPHAIAAGWMEAAVSFVRPSDRKVFAA
jgi:hypothetical protein